MPNTKSFFHTEKHKISEKEIIEFVFQRFHEVKRINKIKNLISFHTANKYMLMAHDQNELKILGDIIASNKKIPFSEIIDEYENHLKLAMSKSPTTKTHTNVIMHIFGYFLKHLNRNEKQIFFDRLEQYRVGKTTLGKILFEINDVSYRFDNTYLASQTYFLLYSDIDSKPLFQPNNQRKYE
ncbi:YbgA family protein [Candidatus Nitrosarchaeum limnium]|uniref:DUF1722 domain-containing protein n=1 Tax=Candidatus Nitrosarchaeum limnium BG20 TaxID=859192 RepID=S2E107_9ARCH|nr:YbgA family protein [Candidatus Nitrosarchaeum limnium]EPA05015.1 hypothetical protein BG20_I1571 [Candidatus Nitrosarchaeum limnium BG20]